MYLDVSFDGVTHPILEVLPRCLQVPRNDEGQIKGHIMHCSNHDKGYPYIVQYSVFEGATLHSLEYLVYLF